MQDLRRQLYESPVHLPCNEIELTGLRPGTNPPLIAYLLRLVGQRKRVVCGLATQSPPPRYCSGRGWLIRTRS